MAFVETWNYESSPTGSDYMSTVDNKMRGLAYALRERLAIQHYTYASETGHTDVYEHKAGECNVVKVSAKSAFPTPASTNSGCLAIATDEANLMYYWSGTAWVSTGIANTPIATTLASVYPIGCIYTSIIATNPSTVFGFGTWTAFGAGRVLVGRDSTDTDFDVAEETGGAKTITLTAAQSGVAAHTHTLSYTVLNPQGSGGGGLEGTYPNAHTLNYTPTTDACSAASAVSAHANVQPYIVVYFWKRTA